MLFANKTFAVTYLIWMWIFVIQAKTVAAAAAAVLVSVGMQKTRHRIVRGMRHAPTTR